MSELSANLPRLDRHQRDVWHVLHVASQVQGRCERALHQLQDRLPIIQRQAERVAQGKKARGRASSANVAEHEHRIEPAQYVTQALDYLCQELQSLLDVVVLRPGRQPGLLSSRERQQELEALLALLEELREQALPTVRKEIQSLAKHLRLALPHLLLFAADLDEPQQQVCERLGARAVHLIAWAWQRRAVLGPTTKQLVEGFDPAWRAEAQALLYACRAFRCTRKSRKNEKGAILSFHREISNAYESEERL